MHTRQLGSWAEEQAVNFLTANGFEILDRNTWSRLGEIDIVAKLPGKDKSKAQLVFVEVKSVPESMREEIYATVSEAKKTKIQKLINWWLNKHNYPLDCDQRMDFVGVIHRDYVPELVAIEHIPYI